MLYIPFAPVTITHIALGFIFTKKNTHSLYTPSETTSVFVPVYNDESLISETIRGIFSQTQLPNSIVISDNGSTDDTKKAILKTLEDYNYFEISKDPTIISLTQLKHPEFSLKHFKSDEGPDVYFMQFPQKTSKAVSINIAKKAGLLSSEWTLVFDSDTIPHCQFVEEINSKRYRLQVHANGTYQIIKANVLGGTVIPRYNSTARWQERLIRDARNAEYAYGQALVRVGQNYTSLFVAPGCGSMIATKDLHMSVKTNVDDLEFTQTIQTYRKSKTVKLGDFKKEVGKDFVEQSYVLVNEEKVHLNEIFEDTKAPVRFTENTAHYVPTASMITQDPQKIKSWWVQCIRWSGGLHQVRYLQGDKIIQKARSAFTVYGALFEGIIGSLLFFGVPTLLIYSAFNNGSFDMERFGQNAAAYGVFDLVATLSLLTAGFYLRNRYQRKAVGKSLVQSIRDVTRCLLPHYASRFMNVASFIFGFAKNAFDYHYKGIKCWSSEWERPHKSASAKNALHFEERMRA